jgi:GNAT superfamily N-acetyltransferase
MELMAETAMPRWSSWPRRPCHDGATIAWDQVLQCKNHHLSPSNGGVQREVSNNTAIDPTHMTNQQRGSYEISDDRSRIDVVAVHQFLSTCYWSLGIPISVVQRAIEGSLCFGVYQGESQVGFARVISDRATFAYLCDVYVQEQHRGNGLGQWLIETIIAHPDLQGLRRFALVTRDAQGLYAKHGFQPLARPEGHMEIFLPNAYASD